MTTMVEAAQHHLLTCAQWYAARGWPVFPCKVRGKEPLTPHGFKDATTDAEQIRAWWRQWPAANIGLAVPVGFAVVDLDSAEALDVLHTEGWSLPATACSRTARGWHYWYKLSAGVRLRNGATALQHVELKTVGGYVMVPPSVHPSGARYRWLTVLAEQNIAPAPHWLEDRAEIEGEPGKARAVGEWASLVRGPVKEGHRRGELLRLGGLLFRRLPAEVAYELAVLWARTSCTPAIEPAEVDRILGDVAALELRRRGGES